MSTATAGMTVGPEALRLNGATFTADLSAALIDATLTRTIDGASTVKLDIADYSRALLRSTLLTQRVTLTVDGLSFELVKVEKSSDVLTATFESSTVAALRRAKGALSAAAGTTTRAGFAARLVAKTPGVTINAYPGGGTVKEPLARGSSSTPDEDTWSALTRLASEVQWRVFETGGVVWFGPDSWLLAQPSQGDLYENTGGVDFIDFDFDVGKPLASATVHCVASIWAFPPGSTATLRQMGVGGGKLIVGNIERSLFLPDATISMVGPQPSLPEPSTTAA